MIAVPDLDTIDFEALVEEGRGLIPRYAPDWTDHNVHDPGMTLLDLLAWFIDQQVYRIGFVSDEHIAAFAALLGTGPKGASPASGLIWPYLGAVASDRTLADRTLAHVSGQPDLAFAVSTEIGLRAAAIVAIEARGGASARKLTPDETGAIALDAGTDTIDLFFDPPLEGGNGAVSLGLAYPEALPDLDGRPPAGVAVRLEGADWRRGDVQWSAGPDDRSGVILLADAGQGNRVAAIRLDLGTGLPRRLLPVRIALNVVPVIQIEYLKSLKIGEGTGWPDHELPLGLEKGQVPLESFDIVSGPQSDRLNWERRDQLASSRPDETHYQFDQARGVIRFGNGVNGRIVPPGHEVSRIHVQVTAGARGNLAAGASWRLEAIATGGTPGFGVNRHPISGGADASTRDGLLTELRRRARKRVAMLTDGDMIGAAMALPGYEVERAEVLPRFLPALPSREVPGARTLLLRPSREAEPTDAWLDAIEAALANRRVLGERLAVAAVEPIQVDVAGELLVAAGSDRERIRHEAERRLRDRLAIARRSDGQDLEPWPAGRPVTVVELETLLASIEGVIAVTGMQVGRAGGALGSEPVPLATLEVAVAGKVAIRFGVES